MRKSKILKQNNGYTLVEVLVSSLIFVAVVAMGVSIFMATSGYRSKTKVMQQVNQAGRYAMEMITRDVKEADGMVSDTDFCGGPVVSKIGFTFLGSGGCFKPSPSSPISGDQLVVYRNGGDCNGDSSVAKIIYKKMNTSDGAGGNYPALMREVTYIKTPPSACTKETTYFNQPGIDAIKFDISGAAPVAILSKEQPYVTVSMAFKTSGYDSAKPEERAEVSLQSTVMSRLVDFK